jgi:hypothetical protein
LLFPWMREQAKEWRAKLQRERGDNRGRVIAHGPDDEELAQRLFADLGDKLFYIAKVEREPTV